MQEHDSSYLVLYCDGSCFGNPGYGGSGVYGYSYKLTNKNKNYKHPSTPTLNFTTKGVFNEKDEQGIEVISIVEVIKAIYSKEATNNLAELEAFILALERVDKLENISTVTIYTDSNYIVTSYNENLDRWVKHNYKKLDGNLVKHRASWETILYHRDRLINLGITINVEWVKAHAGLYCNEIADIYSTIGSNSARRQFRENNEPFKDMILDSIMNYADYKKSYVNKDLIFHFRDLYFNSNNTDDNVYCFLASSEDQHTIGRKDISSIFAINVGYIPDIITTFKQEFRKLNRNYNTTCCIKLNKLEDKDLLRVSRFIDVRDLLVFNEKESKIWFSIVRDNTPFIFENGYEYPFIMNTTKLFNKMLDLTKITGYISPNIIEIVDITDCIVNSGKLIITNKVSNIDLTNRISDKLKFAHKPILTLGRDIPNYIALKKLEDSIIKVEVIVVNQFNSNYATLYTNIRTTDRELYTVNIENKYLLIK